MTSAEVEPSLKRTRWTFDEPCTAMERTERSTPILEVATETTEADLVIIGVFGGNTETLPSQLLSKVRKGLCVCASEDKAFDSDTKPGGMTPVLRVLEEDGTTKVC